ncbi:MAG: tRNA (adenosine(37)-N6)-threonylcarbamoyltransferase complex dimerization subunit type 1 TsaB [Chloroflexota bacterium]|nr:tRNA (adenosine(37)-N6)-threonylcarbamoyltransferase complex dimerization subunit type 1 TsaB [Chloroflexota bacterium]
MLLAIDTATRYASIALYDASGVVVEKSWRSENNHSVEVLPAIARSLSQQEMSPSDLAAVAVAKGPGSFTGLRIGMSIGKGLCLTLDIPIIAIPTLDIVAYATGDPGYTVYAVLQAGRGRICVAPYRFEEGLPVQTDAVQIVETSQWDIEEEGPALVAGEVDDALAERLLNRADGREIYVTSLSSSLRRAGYLAELAWGKLQEGEIDDLDSLGPIYAHDPSS